MTYFEICKSICVPLYNWCGWDATGSEDPLCYVTTRDAYRYKGGAPRTVFL